MSELNEKDLLKVNGGVISPKEEDQPVGQIEPKTVKDTAGPLPVPYDNAENPRHKK